MKDYQALIAEFRKMLESISIKQKHISQDEVRQETDKLLKAIGARTSQPTPSAPRPIITFLHRWGSAAAIVILVLAGCLVFLRTETPKASQQVYASQINSRHLIERINNGNKPDTARFSDGSWVKIAPNSRIAYSSSFDTAAIREVYLSGEAFFQVARSPHHPFHVITGEVVTKVLGTSFCIRSFEKDTTIQVTVKTGKVSVDGIILTPNQRMVYKKAAQSYQKLLLDHPVLLAPETTDDNMVYEDTPLEQVFDQLSKAYGIIIVYDNELLRKCTVTADLKGEPFYHKLDLICRAVGAAYEVVDGQVVIQSSGCQ